MICDLCGRPVESHVCTADVMKLMADNSKLRALLDAEVQRLKLQYLEAAQMASILIQYIHDLKHHQTSIQFCKEEPCLATVEFIGKSGKRSDPVQKCPLCGKEYSGTKLCHVLPE